MNELFKTYHAVGVFFFNTVNLLGHLFFQLFFRLDLLA